MHGGFSHAVLWKGCSSVRRFAWQVGGVGVALAGVVGLGVVAFGCGSGGPAPVRGSASPSARATATVDPRVAEVEAAVRRYVQALVDAMRTGSADEVGALTVPGSQAAGNAGATAHVVQGTGRAFVTTQLQVDSLDVSIVASADASAVVTYTLRGYDATWPALKQVDSGRMLSGRSELELQFSGGQWLVSVQH